MKVKTNKDRSEIRERCSPFLIREAIEDVMFSFLYNLNARIQTKSVSVVSERLESRQDITFGWASDSEVSSSQRNTQTTRTSRLFSES